MKGKYIYAIAKTPRMVAPPMRRGLLRGGKTTIGFRSLSAVVTDVERRDYPLLSKEETIKELTQHQQTIEKVMENFGSVLPVKFGTILKDKEEVRAVLEKRYSFLKEVLRKMEAKIELDLVCFWNEQKAAQLAFQESKKIRDYYTSEVALSEVEGDSSDGEMAKIALGKLVAQYLATKKEKISSQILKVLKKEVVESCSHTLADINMIINQAFLVEKENEEAFNHTLNRLNSRFKELVNFRLVGPLPPYSFATVVIEVLDKDKVESAKKLLKLDGELSREKIKHAFNKLAMRLHPDKGGDPLEFSLAAKGYQLLRKYLNQGLVGVYLYKWKEQGEL